jgi:hypothetical protein
MDRDERYTSYCGLYCLDCIPSNRELFSTVRELGELLVGLRFESYAELKSSGNEIFKEYPRFIEVLHAIGGLECPVPCRDGGGRLGCEVRGCVIDRGYGGCWECGRYMGCELLRPLKEIHPNLEYHLGLIREKGMRGWCLERRGHYRWR